ncbi:hypothetical protein AVEN_172401-1 [Araneus ventricosus]|uniref:Uncharacterized protein n=1 Tax=Araneus ventricosus TaxID=182803 RepID=A0A4Y2KA09_ARAVE|nr:hypothetical protein AVEN_172401-1 [Araneus ventricosus]
MQPSIYKYRVQLHDVVHNQLRLYGYKLQLLHELKPDDKPRRRTFSGEMLQEMEEDKNFLQRVMFSDEATFHVSGIVNRHNTRIWGVQNPHTVLEQARDSPKVKCGLPHDRMNYRAFSEVIIRSDNYLYMLEIFAFPQIEDLQPNIIFQQDGTPPY